MKDFVKVSDVDMWDIIDNGCNPSYKIEDGILIKNLKTLGQKEERKKKHPVSKIKWIISNFIMAK